MEKKNTCVDETVCSSENCRFFRDGCDKEFWKLLVSEGIKVDLFPEYPGKLRLTFTKNNIEILYLQNEEIVPIHPDLVPASLMKLLRNRDIVKLVNETHLRLYRFMNRINL